MRPYYEHAGIAIYHGDCREVLPLIEQPDAILTDPPWGVRKADWDGAFVLPPVPASVRALGLMPGVWNLLRCPLKFGELEYRWTLSAYLINGLARGGVGFGNWIACLLYSAPDISLFVQDGDCKRFVVGREPKPDHPSPKPPNPVAWFLSRVPGQLVCDPYVGSGTTLLAAKNANRRAIGIDIDERHCETSARRLDQGILDFGDVA